MTGVPFDPEATTVDQLMAQHPETMAVFNAFGVDNCCGAHRTVHEAAVEDAVSEQALVEALAAAVRQATTEAP